MGGMTGRSRPRRRMAVVGHDLPNGSAAMSGRCGVD